MNERPRPDTASARLITLGPASSSFAGYHNLVHGDTYYIGSRGTDPARVVGYHLPTWQVGVVREFAGFHEVSALVADGDLLYVAVQDRRRQTRIFSWDTAAQRAEPVADIAGLTIWALKVAGDGVLYAVGGESLSLHEIDLRTGSSRILFTPDSQVTQPPTIVVTADRIFFGSGAQSVGAGKGQACLLEIDRVSGSVTSILPPELAGDLCVVGLLLAGGRLCIGTKAADHPAHFAVMSLPGRTLEFIDQPAGPTGFWALLEADDSVCFFSGTKVYRYRLRQRDITELADFGGAIAGGLQYYRGEVVAMAWPMPRPAGPPKTILHRYHLASGALHKCEIAELNREVRSDPVHSIAAGDGRVYAAAWDLDVHDVRSRTISKVLGMPRMIKAMAVAGDGSASGLVFAAIYDAGQLWTYDPSSSRMQQVGAFLPGHNRPWDMAWDQDNDLVLVGVAADQAGGGSLSIYDPATGRLRSYLDPCGPGEAVHAVAPGSGLAYLAGARSAAAAGHLACWDPVAGERLWTRDPWPGEAPSALAFGEGLLYAITRAATFLVFDTESQEIIHRAALSPGVWPGPGKLTWVSSRCIYGASRNAIIKIEPGTFRLSVLASNLNGQWVGGRACLAVGAAGEIYTLRDRALTCVREL